MGTGLKKMSMGTGLNDTHQRCVSFKPVPIDIFFKPVPIDTFPFKPVPIDNLRPH
ncbi:MAG: hypothetical protein IKF83_00935 [Clostridia bacterium]|nr:hypothetical protein [Clostridia bacterium]